MLSVFTIDFEKIANLNGTKGEAFFKYLKRVSKNNTPIVLHGTKKSNYWDCSVTECSTPTSFFSNIKLPADLDKNSEGANISVQLTSELLSQFQTDSTKFTFKDSAVEVSRSNFKVKCSYINSPENVAEQLREFTSNVDSIEKEPARLTLTIAEDSSIVGFLKELRSSPEASIFVNSQSITLRKDSVFFRTKSTADWQADTDEELYINMYLANLITSYLEYCNVVKVSLQGNCTVVKGYKETTLAESGAVNSELLVKNVSAIFEALDENPSEEDLNSIVPDKSNSNVISLSLADFIAALDEQKASIAAFTGMRSWQAKILKNGNGLSLSFAKANTYADTAVVTVHIGNVEIEEPEVDKFTEYSTIIPLELIKNIFRDNTNIEIVYQDDEETVVMFSLGDAQILSGKIY